MQSISKAFPEVAGKGFEFYTKYIFAQGVSDLVIGFTWIIVLCILALIIKKLYNFIRSPDAEQLSKKSYGNEEWLYVVSFIAVCVIVFFSLVAFSNAIDDIRDGIIKVIAPQGAVVQEIITNLPTKK